MLLLLVMLLLVLVLSQEGMGWLLVAMADPSRGRTAEKRILASVAATKLLRRLTQISCCAISFSGMQSMKSSSTLR
jgi:hypothetical protein